MVSVAQSHVLCSVFQDPKSYVSALLEVHRKYSAMVTSSFGDDAGFMQALDKVDCILQ